MGTVLLVLVAMTAVGTASAAGVTMTAPWLVGRDLQQPQQQQQAMISRMMNNSGPPITAAFSISEKSYHHPKIPATKTHFLLKIDSVILNWLNSKNWVFYGFAGTILLVAFEFLNFGNFWGYFSVTFQSFVLRYLVGLNSSIAPINFSKIVPAPLENNDSRKTFAAPNSPLFYKHDTKNREK